MNALYKAVATARGGRDGAVKSDDGVLDLPLAIPKGLGGPGGAKTNPEQLFAAGYAACFDSALRMIARMQKVTLASDTAIAAHVSIGKNAAGGFDLAVELHGSFGDMPREQAEKLLQAAHEVCPYSRATRGNIAVQLVVD